MNDVVHKVAGVFTTVLVTGESGTGKGLVAKAIHQLSARVEQTLCGIFCMFVSRVAYR